MYEQYLYKYDFIKAGLKIVESWLRVKKNVLQKKRTMTA
jgi:hypothetical protein